MPSEALSCTPPFVHDNEISYLSAGNEVKVFTTDNRVIKVVKAGLSYAEACQTVQMLDEHSTLLGTYIEPYIPHSSFAMGEGRVPGKVDVVVVQPKITGMILSDALKGIYSGEYDPQYVLDFLERSLTMYRLEGRMPDFFADMYQAFLNLRLISPINLKFFPNDRRNIYAVPNGRQLFPYLVDPVICRSNLRSASGKLYDFPLAAKTRVTVERLRRL